MGHWLGESAWSTLEAEQVVDIFMNGAFARKSIHCQFYPYL